MDVLVNLAKNFGFHRVCTTLNRPIVFHCVPGAGKSTLIRDCCRADSRFVAVTLGKEDERDLTGAGKSTLIRDCCRADSRFVAVTLGKEDERDLTGVGIAKYSGSIPDCEYPLLDEYTLAESLSEGWFAIFGDPIQAANRVVLRAHFTSNLSRRFGRCTAQFLRELGFDVVAEGEDIVQISGIYVEDPRDKIIYYEPEVGCLLRSHSVEASHITEVIGQTFDSVTFVTASEYPKDRSSAYQCLTRHRKSLLILAPNASYSPA